MEDEIPEYPKEIEVEWSKTHISMILLSFFIWPAFFYINQGDIFPKILSVAGLFLNSVGATVATLKPPFYGLYMDGGALQRKSEKIAYKYFRFGMLIVALGFILQAVKEVL
ncbi:hypothetical protein [Comamonas sp. AG1104]|uniref:hypothetical protein n=1 Tax=Comamonas sp. AG1104 TaxID=2183900 RepID=UPI0011C075E7|nr:hypothetical protein [Comamonas sp. AG1104]